MISQVSNQPSFKGSVQGIMKSTGAAHHFPTKHMQTVAKDDIFMIYGFGDSLRSAAKKGQVKTAISQDGQTLSFTTKPKFFRDNLPNPFKYLYDRSKGFSTVANQRKQYYTQNMLYRSKTQSVTYSISKEDFQKAQSTAREILKEDSEKAKKVTTTIRNNLFCVFHKFCMLDFKYAVADALPKEDKAKAKAFFKN